VTGPLRLPAFRFLFWARAISYVGTYLAPIAVAFAILDNGGGATAVGVSFAAWTLAQVAMLSFGGVVGDRVPRRTVMIGSDIASTAVRATMGVLLVSGHAEIWQLIALQACGGAAVAFYSPASYGLVREVVPEDQLQQANGLLAIARYAAFPLGAAIGGSIVALIGPGTALLVDAGTYAASALLLSQIRVTSIARAGAGFFRELREGWSAFVEQTWVWVLVLYVSLYFLITYAPFFVLGPYVAKHTMDGARSWAFVVTGEGVGALLGGVAGLRWRPRQPMVTTGLLLMVTAAQDLIPRPNEPGCDRDRQPERGTPHGSDLVRLGGRPCLPQHGRGPPSPPLHAREPGRVVDRPRRGQLVRTGHAARPRRLDRGRPRPGRHRPALRPLLRQAVPQQGRETRHCVDGGGPLDELASSALRSSLSTTQSDPSPHSIRRAPSTSANEVASTRTGLPSSSSSAPRSPPSDIA
jgi:MFS family permease